MAQALVENMTTKWDPKKYKDDYRDALIEVIEEKVEAGGEEIEEKPKLKKPSSKIIDLVAVLQQSLAKTRRRQEEANEQGSEVAFAEGRMRPLPNRASGTDFWLLIQTNV